MTSYICLLHNRMIQYKMQISVHDCLRPQEPQIVKPVQYFILLAFKKLFSPVTFAKFHAIAEGLISQSASQWRTNWNTHIRAIVRVEIEPCHCTDNVILKLIKRQRPPINVIDSDIHSFVRDHTGNLIDERWNVCKFIQSIWISSIPLRTKQMFTPTSNWRNSTFIISITTHYRIYYLYFFFFCWSRMKLQQLSSFCL